MTERYKFGDMTRQELIELAREWSGRDTIFGDNQKIEEVSDQGLRNWLSRNQPCPATKRNGELCGSTLVSVSGYCFAHDPESAEWRAMGGRAKSKKARARKKLRELGLEHMAESLEEMFDELREGNATAADARAMAGIASTLMKLLEWAAETDREPKTPKNGGWFPYDL